METLKIEMRKLRSTKRFDVFESVKTDAPITTVYINQAAGAPDSVILSVSVKE